MTDISSTSQFTPDKPVELKARVRWGDRVVGTLVVIVLALIVYGWTQNEALRWSVVGEYLFNPQVMDGVQMTLMLTAAGSFFGILLSIIVAMMRMSKNKLLNTVSAGFVWIFRAIPLLVLLIVVYNIGLIYPVLNIGIPFGPTFASYDIQNMLTPFWSATLALTLHEAAFGSEIVRASILSVNRGQVEAAETLGMTSNRVMRRIVIPQALRIAIPPLMNNVITMLKGTSIVAFIAVPDLLYSVQRIYNLNYQIMPLLLVATGWYLFLVSVLTSIQYMLERHFAKDIGKKENPLARLKKSMGMNAE